MKSNQQLFYDIFSDHHRLVKRLDKKAHRIDRSWKCQIHIGKGRICSLVRRRFESGKLLLMEIMNFCDEFLWQFFVMNFVTFLMNSGDICGNILKNFWDKILWHSWPIFVTFVTFVTIFFDKYLWQIFVTNFYGFFFLPLIRILFILGPSQ